MKKPIALALSLLFLSVCGSKVPVTEDPPPEPSTHAAPKHVLLITLDTFRFDYLGASGSGRARTPHLDELATKGTMFTRARAPVPLTLPSHASLFTGLYPPEHGVRDNVRFQLGSRTQTLAERLREAGFRTGGFPAAFVLDSRFGLDKGFDRYDDELSVSLQDLESPDAERAGSEVLKSFFSWLDEGGLETPFFGWVHFFEPHAPYAAPDSYRAQYPNDPYAAEIAYTDALVGRLLDGMEERNLLTETLVVVSGDHGEGLAEHGETTHALLTYNSTLHVPLILSGPSVPAWRSEKLVRTIDVAATILELVGLDPHLGRGRSLRAVWSGDARENLTAYSESLYARYHLGWSPLFGLETESFHFIESSVPELYDVEADPGELRNVIQRERATAREMKRRLEEVRDELETTVPPAPATELDAEAERRLESLGYLSSASSPPGRGELADPKERIETYETIHTALAARKAADCHRVVATLRPMTETFESALVYETLGACYQDLGDDESAADVYRRAIRAEVATPESYVSLGVIALRKRDFDEAKRILENALSLDPNLVRAHYYLGEVLRASQKNEEALVSYERALALNPRYVYAWSGKGVCLSRLGRTDESIDAFRKAVDVSPEDPRGHFNLAAQLEIAGRLEEARESYRRFLELAPRNGLDRERQRATRALEAAR